MMITYIKLLYRYLLKWIKADWGLLLISWMISFVVTQGAMLNTDRGFNAHESEFEIVDNFHININSELIKVEKLVSLEGEDDRGRVQGEGEYYIVTKSGWVRRHENVLFYTLTICIYIAFKIYAARSSKAISNDY